jgi:hypothetical protein
VRTEILKTRAGSRRRLGPVRVQVMANGKIREIGADRTGRAVRWPRHREAKDIVAAADRLIFNKY